MKKSLIVLLAFGLMGCSTPTTYLKDPKTGKLESCGGGNSGSIMGGYLGYSIQKENDRACVQKLREQGYRVEQTEE